MTVYLYEVFFLGVTAHSHREPFWYSKESFMICDDTNFMEK